MKSVKIFFLAFLFLFLTRVIFAQVSQTQIEFANRMFKVVKEICEKDNGKLWGQNLWGPILIINNDTRFIVANEKDNEGVLKESGKVFIGDFPPNKIFAYSSVFIFGKQWATIAYPMYTGDSLEMKRTFIHEMFHSLQEKIKIGNLAYSNDHIDKKIARICLQLECNALKKAITSSGKEQEDAICDALLFRTCRRKQFAGSDSMENRFELQEGLAFYTELKLGSDSENYMQKKLYKGVNTLMNEESYFRIFGYYTGASYAYLNDISGVCWKKLLNNKSDLSEICRTSFNINFPANIDSAYEVRKFSNNYEEISKNENSREEKIIKRNKELKDKFTAKPLLIINCNNDCSYIIHQVYTVDSLGYYYPNTQLSGPWGILNVPKEDEGCLISLDYSKAYVPYINVKKEGNKIYCDLWELFLEKNWIIKEIDGNYTIIEEN